MFGVCWSQQNIAVISPVNVNIKDIITCIYNGTPRKGVVVDVTDAVIRVGQTTQAGVVFNVESYRCFSHSKLREGVTVIGRYQGGDARFA